MSLWFIVGLIVWTMCMLFMLGILKGGHRIRGHGYEQKLYFQYKSKHTKWWNLIGEISKSFKG